MQTDKPHPDALYIRLVGNAFRAFARHDVEAFLALVQPDVEFTGPTAEKTRGGKPYVGESGIREYFRDVEHVWLELRLIPQLFGRRGNVVVVAGRVYARDAEGLTDSPTSWLMEEADGKISRLEVHTNRQGAMLAAGIDESELKPFSE
jgi:ketosteroid isomerase-like protein